MFYPRAISSTRVLPTEVPGKEWFYWGMDAAGWCCWIIFRVHWGCMGRLQGVELWVKETGVLQTDMVSLEGAWFIECSEVIDVLDLYEKKIFKTQVGLN